MKREIYLDCAFGFMRAAVVEDGRLCELLCERACAKKLTETIFLGRVEQIRPSVGAAFVNIGEELNAFLPLEDGHTLRCGDMIIVQGAAKQATETKGLRVTSRVNLAGKWLVLIPGESGIHVSKKVKAPELRAALAEIAAQICPQGFGLIVRTASEDVTVEAMQEEAEALSVRWQAISMKAAAQRKPGVLSEQLTLDLRVARDLAGKELESIVTNDSSCCNRLKEEQAAGRIPAKTSISCLKETGQLLFDLFGIEPQIDKALKRRVWLPCGGYLIIDPCEAMTVIDVNSGKMTLGRNAEDTALSVNLEAADEIARQIRLRDIGGIIVVDFIDMEQSEHREILLSRMKDAVKADRSPVRIEGITRLGLLEMTRKRVKASLLKTLKAPCTYCSSSGDLIAPEEIAQRALRQVKRTVLSGHRGPFIIHCAQGAANALCAIRTGLDAQVFVVPATSRHAERFEIEQIGENAPLPKGAVALIKD